MTLWNFNSCAYILCNLYVTHSCIASITMGCIVSLFSTKATECLNDTFDRAIIMRKDKYDNDE